MTGGVVKRRGWRPTGLFALLVAALAGCRPAPPPEEASSEAAPVLVGPENVVEVRRELIQTGPRIAGSLQPRRQSTVRAEVGGSVTAVQAELGQGVKARQVLARIEAFALPEALASARSALVAAQSDLELARRQAERTARLVQAGALSERDLELARSAVSANEARLKEARARVASAQRQLRSATVYSPLRGVVSQRGVSVGDVVAPGALLFTIIDPSSMRLEASVPSEALSVLSVGAPVTFEVRGYPEQTFTGEIERIAPAADPVTRQIALLVSIPNPEGRLIAGLFAEGRVAARSREGLVLPVDAVDEIGTSASVLRITGETVQRVPVRIGLRDERTERLEVLEGLEPGDRVLRGAARSITPGTKITLTTPSAGASPPDPSGGGRAVASGAKASRAGPEPAASPGRDGEKRTRRDGSDDAPPSGERR